MRILVVSYYFRPSLTPRAFRWESIASVWASAGHEVDVVTSAITGVQPWESTAGVEVHRTGSKWLDRLRNRFRPSEVGSRPDDRAANGRGQVDSRDNTVGRSGLRQAAQRVYDLTWKQVMWPDFSSMWYFSAVTRAQQLVSDRKYDALVSVSLPFTGHLVGLRIKSRCPSLRWLVDIGDPFCWGGNERSLNNPRLYRRLNVAAERRVFELADHVAVTNSRTCERYGDMFGPAAAEKIRVIGPVIGPKVLDSSPQPEPFSLPADRINIVFAGALVSSVRRPKEFLAWMDRVACEWNKQGQPKLLFHLIGSAGDFDSLVRDAGISHADVRYHGLLPQEQALAALRRAHCVLNCGNTTDYQLPSKVYEYMATGKPILNVVFNPRDPAIDALNEYPQAIHCHAGEEPTVELLEFLRGSISQTSTPDSGMHSAAVRDHLVPNIASKYAELLGASPIEANQGLHNLENTCP